ncbi:hypothetical protein ACJX0J_039946, partial [Zea mays]
EAERTATCAIVGLCMGHRATNTKEPPIDTKDTNLYHAIQPELKTEKFSPNYILSIRNLLYQLKKKLYPIDREGERELRAKMFCNLEGMYFISNFTIITQKHL